MGLWQLVMLTMFFALFDVRRQLRSAVPTPDRPRTSLYLPTSRPFRLLESLQGVHASIFHLPRLSLSALVN